ncbi:Transglutaminase-like enzyme, putative cysteine protease [Neorhodopirellula lusitana]|uniref:Transglutaminase-like enzyme, putative cysteine protease n=1 Tax=Neorhodopirellula lusitana TaxID=445327 RepID=A0ABY1PWU0_9BACT|nr:transglutaminase family protein [Neorhodopirellula lusitana]SMP48323.1 Transglutaminase-like enzyme, putative cysteine protease [Neorhodopirellula lusitana]
MTTLNSTTTQAEYRIVHRTSYQYSEPVALCQNQLRMRPRNLPHLTCHSCDVEITPKPTSADTHPDYYGNVVDSFSIEALHSSLEVVVRSHLTVFATDDASLAGAADWSLLAERVRRGDAPEDWRAREFTFDSARIPTSEKFAQYARQIMLPGMSIIDAVDALTSHIHKDFRYDGTATDVNTSTVSAFEMKAGVCQDFAHVQIACLRSLGLPARYVSGYLRTFPPPGKPRLIGCDESHAWISVYAGVGIGWVDFDPTNAVRTGTDHIPICHGRDYDDISPMRGIVLGGGSTTLKVSVDVAPVEKLSQDIVPSQVQTQG